MASTASEGSSQTRGSTTTLPSMPAYVPIRPPKSKTEPHYSILSSWSDVKPIPQADLNDVATYTSEKATPSTSEAAETLASAGPALATIAYTPRYAEAMSYLRALMAANEFSERALALTEDIIGMNPAHYTVWNYRFRILKVLWGVDSIGDNSATHEKTDARTREQAIVEGVEEERKWLENVSERNLKNYQIWYVLLHRSCKDYVLTIYNRHHRTSLINLLPAMPDSEPKFLGQILSLDTKNYHVWSYRQWLCTRFPDPLLTTGMELDAMEIMIRDDVLNNSAWNHRWFVVFGWKELEDTGLKNLKEEREKTGKVVDLDVVDREVEYTKNQIRIAPQNGSSWNYLKGVMKYAGVPVTDMKEFCAEFVGDGYDFYIEDGTDGRRGVRSSQAIEMLVDVFNVEGGDFGRTKVKEALDALSEKWDPIRRKYWQFRLSRFQQGWKSEE